MGGDPFREISLDACLDHDHVHTILLNILISAYKLNIFSAVNKIFCEFINQPGFENIQSPQTV